MRVVVRQLLHQRAGPRPRVPRRERGPAPGHGEAQNEPARLERAGGPAVHRPACGHGIQRARRSGKGDDSSHRGRGRGRSVLWPLRALWARGPAGGPGPAASVRGGGVLRREVCPLDRALHPAGGGGSGGRGEREEEERGSDGRTAAAGAEGAPEGTGRLERRDVAPPTPSFLSRGYRRGESRIRFFWSIFWRERERENTDAKGREKEREKLTS